MYDADYLCLHVFIKREYRAVCQAVESSDEPCVSYAGGLIVQHSQDKEHFQIPHMISLDVHLYVRYGDSFS